jgi:hypothetical protein
LDLSATEALFSTKEAIFLTSSRELSIDSKKLRQKELAGEAVKAAVSRNILARKLLAEAAVFAEIVGQSPRPPFAQFSKGYTRIVSPVIQSSRLLWNPARVGVIVVNWETMQFGWGSSTLTAKVMVRLQEPLRRSMTLMLQQGVEYLGIASLTPEYDFAAGRRSAQISFKDMQIRRIGNDLYDRPVLNLGKGALLFQYIQYRAPLLKAQTRIRR